MLCLLLGEKIEDSLLALGHGGVHRKPGMGAIECLAVSNKEGFEKLAEAIGDISSSIDAISDK